jgi:nucleotide-binding universal stress UspA family protein
VQLAESLNAKVTAAYVTEDFTWKELRKIYALDELKWPGAGRAGKGAVASAEAGKATLAKEALALAEKMCADRGIPCETVHLSDRFPLHGVLKLAEERRCDVIVTSTDPRRGTEVLSNVREGKINGQRRIPVLFHVR